MPTHGSGKVAAFGTAALPGRSEAAEGAGRVRAGKSSARCRYSLLRSVVAFASLFLCVPRKRWLGSFKDKRFWRLTAALCAGCVSERIGHLVPW